ncbi:hypothetical protein GWI33_000001 [Rhynchophorus ferrugineus]|uniref:Uncharacterized protein n=1 Tax=Rhynchophorus ferrugineus TaxID=354439 RepID=A0A834MLV0_RHYFE|nr:hypothetical protein GWI33_000001 [Rhynchophorus ferrugineus]
MKSILLLALLSVLQSATNPLPMKKDQQTAGTDDLKASPSSSIHYTVGASLSNSNFDQAKSPLRSTVLQHVKIIPASGIHIPVDALFSQDQIRQNSNFVIYPDYLILKDPSKSSIAGVFYYK